MTDPEPALACMGRRQSRASQFGGALMLGTVLDASIGTW